MARTRQPFKKDASNVIDLRDYDLTREEVVVVTRRPKGPFMETWRDGTLFNGQPRAYRLEQDGNSRFLVDSGMPGRRHDGERGLRVAQPTRDAELFSIEDVGSSMVAPGDRVYVIRELSGKEYRTGPVRGVWVREKRV